MEKQFYNKVEDSGSDSGGMSEFGISRRNAMRLIAGGTVALMFGCAPLTAYIKREEPEISERFLNLDDLPKSQEDVYLLLFENNPNDNSDGDDFIADAAEVMGYEKPNHWHAEVMYFDPGRSEWMVIGCRPPTCSGDFPVDDLKHNLRGYTAQVRRLRVPLDQQIEARKWFEEKLQGREYSLLGPNHTNCTDAVVGLGEHGDIIDVQNARKYTRDEIKRRPGISGFLGKWGLPSVDDIMRRDWIVFPDEFEEAGRFIGEMRF